jgi:hypothetical protein
MIALAADSRTTLSLTRNGKRVPVAFVDLAQKVFVHQSSGHGILLSGPAVINGHFLSYHVNLFSQDDANHCATPAQTLIALLNHVRSKILDAPLIGVSALVVGFQSDDVMAAVYRNGRVSTYSALLGRLCNHSCRPWRHRKLDENPGPAVIAHVEAHCLSSQSSGGPIDCVILDRSGHTWIRRKETSLNHSNIIEFIGSIERGAIPLKSL